MKTTKKSVYSAPAMQVVKCNPVQLICNSVSDVEEGYVKPVDDVSFKA